MGIVVSILDTILGFVVNIALLLVELVILPFRFVGWLISGCLGRTGTGYFSKPWGWHWERRNYFTRKSSTLP